MSMWTYSVSNKLEGVGVGVGGTTWSTTSNNIASVVGSSRSSESLEKEERRVRLWNNTRSLGYKLVLGAISLAQSILTLLCLYSIEIWRVVRLLHSRSHDQLLKIRANKSFFKSFSSTFCVESSLLSAASSSTEIKTPKETAETFIITDTDNSDNKFTCQKSSTTNSTMTIEVSSNTATSALSISDSDPISLPENIINMNIKEEEEEEEIDFIGIGRSISCSSSSDIEEEEEDEILQDLQVEEICGSGDGDSSGSEEVNSGEEKIVDYRRDSDTSDYVSSSDGCGSEDSSIISPELASKIIAQVELMFSDEHLAKDGFLLKHVRRRSDGFVSLKLVAGLRKVKQISREFPTILNALKKSSRLEVNSEGSKVRRLTPLTSQLKSLPISSQNKENKNKETTRRDSINKEEKDENNKNNQRKRGGSLPINNRRQNLNSGSPPNGNGNGQYMGRPKSNSHCGAHPFNNSPQYNNTNGNWIQQRRASAANGFSNSNSNNNNIKSNNSKNYKAENDDSNTQTVVRRQRGNSLPVVPRPNSSYNSSTSGANSSSPPSSGFQRPKSNSYCDGVPSSNMSSWLKKRMAAQSEGGKSNGIISGVIRQPRGPDGTPGFHHSSTLNKINELSPQISAA